ncbi:MAG: YgiQ family radical SAM protein, partial [Bacteroidaceae bacterium]|nr:YgiQ family radical SAM protein [Bacteroidaceae bacterium]
NKYTAARRLRSEDAYSPDGRHDLRPEYPTIVYTNILRQLFPDVPIVLGGIEASLRRVMHYDYWQERFRPSILCDCDADLITYGMGEKPTLELVRLLTDAIDQSHPLLHYDEKGEACITRQLLREVGIANLKQTVTLWQKEEIPGGINNDDIVLHSYEECLKQPQLHAENFRHIEEESNKIHAQRLLQQTGNKWVVVNPPYPPLTSEELDHSFDLPYTRLPHPKYKGKRIPAYEMIKFSVTLHRGCFGGCAFCTISAHQGKFIVSRSKESILREIKAICQMPDFKGYLSDLGGPSANMYQMHGKRKELCEKCKRPSCIHPAICPNLNGDHRPLLDIYRSVDALPGIKKSFIGSGVRYDMLLHDWKDDRLNNANKEYTRELITKHVSGRLKVAPEHTSDEVLKLMRKPSFSQFRQFKSIFDQTCRQAGIKQQIIPYFISSHPSCTALDMADLAIQTKQMDFHLEQVQDFTPTPLTMATTCWATGYNPYTLQPVFSAKTPNEKQQQRMFFFWYKPEEKRHIEQYLHNIGRTDLLKRLYTTTNPTKKRNKS